MSRNTTFRRPQYQQPVPNYRAQTATINTRYHDTPPAKSTRTVSNSPPIPDYHPLIVPGLDVLIGDPDILAPENREVKRKADYLFIPTGYIDRLNDFYNELSSRGEASRQIVKLIGQIKLEMNRQRTTEYTCKNGMKIIFEETPSDIRSSKLQAITVAKALQRHNGQNFVAIMSGSDPLIASAAMNDIDVARVNPDIYTGRRILDLPASQFQDTWGVQRFLSKDDLKPYLDTPLQLNEYIELKFNGQTVTRRGHFDYVGRFTGRGIEPLRTEKIDHPAYRSILPRTAGQAMLLDALLAPVDEIAVIIVIGTFGTGKTFLTTAAGLAGCEAEMYERVVVCPSDGNLGKDIGAVPGDTTRKTLVKARPITDNLREILWIRNDAPPATEAPEGSAYVATDQRPKKKRKSERQQDAVKRSASLSNRVDDITDKFFTFIPLIELQGRTIPRSFIIMDEFENTERYQARGMLSRIGDYSKIVALGDPFQVNNPHLNDTSNGLSYAATKLGGKPYVAVVTLHESEVTRSAAAQTIAKYLR